MDPFSVFLSVIQRTEVIAALAAACLFGSLVSYVARTRRRGGLFGADQAAPKPKRAGVKLPRPALFARKARPPAEPSPDGAEDEEEVEFHREDEEDRV